MGYNSKPVWWNNVITDINKPEWFDVEYTDENFIDYEEISYEHSLDDIMYSDKSLLQNSRKTIIEGMK